jgi:outer membrane cobalamin receptor
VERAPASSGYDAYLVSPRLRFFLFVTAASAVAHAQETKPAKAAEPEQIVVTGTRTPERAQKSTVKTDVVTRDEAERRGATRGPTATWAA